jgi:hypothetical protein
MSWMSVEQQQEPTPPVPAIGQRTRDPVVAAYTSRMRRLSLWYGGIVALVIAAVVAWVVVFLSGSEVAHATLHQASQPAPDIKPTTTSSSPQLAWSNGDRLAIGEPFWAGTVITFDEHRVSGRNGATGAATWTYTRTDLSICDVAQERGKTIAIYKRDGNCDEIDAFVTTTGARAWSRTLDSDGQPTNGVPSVAVSANTLLLTTPEQVHAIDPDGGLDRWNTRAPSGCTDVASTLGPNAVLISQQCRDGRYLFLRDPYAGDKDNDKPNPKLQLWRVKVDNETIPVSASELVSAYEPASGDLLVYSNTGSVSSRISLGSPTAGTPSPSVTTTSGVDVIWLSGRAYGFAESTQSIAWQKAIAGPPLLGPSATDVVAVDGGSVVALNASTGAVTATYSTKPSPSGSVAYYVGAGLLVGRGPTTSDAGVALYR